MHTQLTGGILTGGQARRLQSLGDIDKGLIELDGQPLVAHTAHKLQPYSSQPLLISANRNKTVYQSYGQVIADPDYLADYQGPLAGVLAMLTHCTTDWLMVLPVDSPFIPATLIPELWQAHLAQPTATAFYVQHERTYPLCLLLHRRCASSLKAYLLAGQRRVQGWLAEQAAVGVDMRHYAAEDFFNINEPIDVKNARERAF